MKATIVFFILCALFKGVIAQDQNQLCQISTEGTEFWFGFMEAYTSDSYFLYNDEGYPSGSKMWIFSDSTRSVEITVVARERTSFKVTIGPDQIPYGTFYVGSNSSVKVEIPWKMVEPHGSEKAENKGIHLIADKPVNVYALNYGGNSGEVSVIYPLKALGKEYFAICYETDTIPNRDHTIPNSGHALNGRCSEFVIVATEDFTTIKITPSKLTDNNKPKDSTFIVILNRGQLYQVQSGFNRRVDKKGRGDLSGSHVRSDKPIAFYSGSVHANIPIGSKYFFNHLYEQIPCVQSWGKEYYAIPLKSGKQARYRIMAARDATSISFTGEAPVTINRGEFVEIVVDNDRARRIIGNKPIMVAQFNQSRRMDDVRDKNKVTTGVGDPFMLILNSSAQVVNQATFNVYDANYTTSYGVNILTLTEDTANITFNGKVIQGEFKVTPSGKYSYAQKSDVVAGTHRIRNLNEDGGFLAYVYSYGELIPQKTYPYADGVGFELNLTLDLGESAIFNGDSLNLQGDTLTMCHGDTCILDAGAFFDTYKWNTGDSVPTIEVTKSGKYKIEVSTVNGCEMKDSIIVFVGKPETELGVDVEACAPFEIKLNGGNGFERYLWQNNHNDSLSINQVYPANQTGEYRLTVFDDYGCPARDTMNLAVFPAPITQIQGDSVICGSLETELLVSITDSAESVWDFENNFFWSSSNPEELSFSDKKHTSVKIQVNDWGEYEIYYQLTTADGCLCTDTFKIRFHPQPSSSFTFEDDAKCEGYSKKLLFNGEATFDAKFYWDLDGCRFVDTLDWQEYNVSVGAFLDRQPFIKLVINDNGCWSDTTIHPIGAKPNFSMDVDKQRGCDSLTVNFTSELLTLDNVIFEWEFDDGEISTKQNTTKQYKNTGFFDVSLTITNPVTHCQNGFTIDSLIKIFPTPVAEIKADPSFCYPDTALVIYRNNIDSSICEWEFEGAHQLGSGNDSILIYLDNPTAKIKLSVNEYGCFSAQLDSELHRKPHFDFQAENKMGCQPFLAKLEAISMDDFLTFEWITDSLPNSQGTTNQIYYPDTGSFDVMAIAASSETGCVDTLIKRDLIWVSPRPKTKFEVDYPVATIKSPQITFTNLSESGENYFWDFGDNQTMRSEDAKHIYKDIGNYKAMLIAESVKGCFDTTSLLIQIVPFSVFTPNAFRPNSEIPENTTFMPIMTGINSDVFYLSIYDRWGQIVFESKSPDNPWDGTTRNGNPAPMGNYIWISKFVDVQGFEHKQKGQVLLIR